MADKIRVLQVPGSLRVGGLETVAVNLYKFCDKSKYSFDYVVYGENVEPLEEVVKELGGRVFHVPYPHVGVSVYLRELKKIMKEFGPYDVVHAHSLFNSGLVVKAASDMNVPVRISHAHSDRRNTRVSFFRAIYNESMRFLINRCTTHKIACSEGAGEYLYGRCFDKNVYIAKNGVNVEEFKFCEDGRLSVKREFGWENCRIVGHIGRLVPVKNQKKIIDVFFKAYQKKPDMRLLIVGDGELRKELQQYIDKLGLTEVAKLTGTRRDVPALLSAFDVYIMPSFYEGVSISLVEAQASGVHCLVSSNAAANEIRITDCINILELNDSDDVWAETVLKLVDKERVAGSYEKVIESGYDVKKIVQNTLALYGGEENKS